MSFNPESFTEKTNEALAAAMEQAREYGHVQLTPSHLALAMMNDAEGLLKRYTHVNVFSNLVKDCEESQCRWCYYRAKT
jgi:ATP-dependent Clp protease ATP-binding subunit ClpA